jgi:hypothetical protein
MGSSGTSWVENNFGRIAIANSDPGATAYTDVAINEASRAVNELLADEKHS